MQCYILPIISLFVHVQCHYFYNDAGNQTPAIILLVLTGNIISRYFTKAAVLIQTKSIRETVAAFVLNTDVFNLSIIHLF